MRFLRQKNDNVQEAMNACERFSGEGIVGRLFHAMRRNSNKTDDDEIIFSCLDHTHVFLQGIYRTNSK